MRLNKFTSTNSNSTNTRDLKLTESFIISTKAMSLCYSQLVSQMLSKCNESVLFFRCAVFVGSYLVNLIPRGGRGDFTEHHGLLPERQTLITTFINGKSAV